MSQTYKLVSLDGDYALGNHDVALDSVGRAHRLTGADKLTDDIQKILFTEFNKFWPVYGTQLQDLIGSNLGLDNTKSILATRVTNSIVYLQVLQNDQRKYQNCDAGEIIASIDQIAVTYNGEVSSDPDEVFTFTCAITVSNLLGQNVTVSQSANLSGSNNGS